MAEKRMILKSIIESDDFLDMSKDARLLYCALCMDADDDGFLKSVKRVCRVQDIDEETIQELKKADLVISFENGVICIKDWFRSNKIDSKMYKPTAFTQEASYLNKEEAKKKHIRYEFKKQN